MPVIEGNDEPTLKELEDEWAELTERYKVIELDLEHAKIDQAAGRPLNLQWFHNATHAAAKIRLSAFRIRLNIDSAYAEINRKRKEENIAKAAHEAANSEKNFTLDRHFARTAKSILSTEQFQTIMGLAQGRFDNQVKAKKANTTNH